MGRIFQSRDWAGTRDRQTAVLINYIIAIVPTDRDGMMRQGGMAWRFNCLLLHEIIVDIFFALVSRVFFFSFFFFSCCFQCCRMFFCFFLPRLLLIFMFWAVVATYISVCWCCCYWDFCFLPWLLLRFLFFAVVATEAASKIVNTKICIYNLWPHAAYYFSSLFYNILKDFFL